MYMFNDSLIMEILIYIGKLIYIANYVYICKWNELTWNELIWAQYDWKEFNDDILYSFCLMLLYPLIQYINPWQFSARNLSRALEHKWHADATDLCPWLRWATPQTGGEKALLCQISAVDLFLHADLDFDIIDPVVALQVEKRKRKKHLL